MRMKVRSPLRWRLQSVMAAAALFRATRRAACLLAVLMIGTLIGASPAGASGVPFNTGDVLANVGGGIIRHFSSTGTLLDTLDSTTGTNEGDGMCFDATGNLYATEGFVANTVSKFDNNGNLLAANFGSGYNLYPESCVFDAADHIYVGQPDGSEDVLKFDTSGTPLGSFDPATESRGTDWLDLASDQCTLHYTSEGVSVKSFDVCTNTQNPNFATGLPGPNAYAHRILSAGGELVADSDRVVRLDSSGNVVQTYLSGNADLLFALNLDPDGTSFWTAEYFSGTIYRIDIATGAVITSFSAGQVSPLGGIAIVGETTAAQPVLTLEPATGTNNVGSSHTVTATLKTGSGSPISGATILFTVTGANTSSGSDTTDTNGEATFTYTGTNAGGDTITACYDKNTNSSCDTGEKTATATKTWTQTATPCVIKITNGGWIVTDDGDRGSFGGVAKETIAGIDSGSEEYQDHGPAEPMNVHSLSIVDITCNSNKTQASIFGIATIDGTGAHPFQIDVQDNGEPGKGRDHYRIRIPDTGYDSGDHILRGGNVQIH
jgi:hypothetical protein